MTNERLYVVVSGPPGSGKTTLAPAIAEHFGLPLVAKDTIKEALMSAMPPDDVEASRRLGRAAVAAMYAVAAEAPRGAVIEGAFYRSWASAELRSLPGRVIEVFCRCDPAVALARYEARAGARHVGYFDRERTPDELQHPEVSEPVAGGWPVLEADTGDTVDLRRLLGELEALVRRA